MIKIFVEAEDVADYHQQIAGEEPPDLHLVAKNDNAESCVYISDDMGMPVITVTLHGIEVETMTGFDDSDEFIDSAIDVYERYIMVVDDKDIDMKSNDEIEEDDEEYSDEDLKEMFGKDDEEAEAEEFEFEYEMKLEEVFRLLVDERELMEFSDSCEEEYLDMLDYLKNEIRETLGYYGLDVKRSVV